MYRKRILDNGLRVVTHDIKDRESVGIGIFIGTGGRYEQDQQKGSAHFLEHILFKGSKKYTCEAIKESIEGVGGTLNAFTSEEETCYFAKVPTQYIQRSFDILVDMVNHPLIGFVDVKKEKTVIIEEIKMYRDIPQYFVIELLDELMWPNHPLGKKLAGTPETVGRLTSKDLKAFHHRYYFPSNIVVSVCGRFKDHQFLKLAEKKFPKADIHNLEKPLRADISQGHPRIRLFRKEIEQMHLALGVLGYEEEHKDRYALSLLNIILGGNMSSRLFNEVREKRGLAYSISSSTKSFYDTGIFMVRAGIDNTKIVEALKVILHELEKIRLKGVSKGEFARARDYFLGQFLLALEDTLDHMLWLGESLLSKNKIETLTDVIKQVKTIKIYDIQRVAQDILRENKFNLAVVGPISDQQEQHLRRLIV